MFKADATLGSRPRCDIYAQFVPDSQRRAIEQTSKMAAERIANAQAARAVTASMIVNEL